MNQIRGSICPPLYIYIPDEIQNSKFMPLQKKSSHERHRGQTPKLKYLFCSPPPPLLSVMPRDRKKLCRVQIILLPKTKRWNLPLMKNSYRQASVLYPRCFPSSFRNSKIFAPPFVYQWGKIKFLPLGQRIKERRAENYDAIKSKNLVQCKK